MLIGIVEDLPDRREVASHHPLHAVDGTDDVALVDHVRSAGSDEEVLGLVGHADDLVGDDLSDRKDKVECRVQDHPVDLDGHTLLPEAFRDLGDE